MREKNLVKFLRWLSCPGDMSAHICFCIPRRKTLLLTVKWHKRLFFFQPTLLPSVYVTAELTFLKGPLKYINPISLRRQLASIPSKYSRSGRAGSLWQRLNISRHSSRDPVRNFGWLWSLKKHGTERMLFHRRQTLSNKLHITHETQLLKSVASMTGACYASSWRHVAQNMPTLRCFARENVQNQGQRSHSHMCCCTSGHNNTPFNSSLHCNIVLSWRLQ